MRSVHSKLITEFFTIISGLIELVRIIKPFLNKQEQPQSMLDAKYNDLITSTTHVKHFMILGPFLH